MRHEYRVGDDLPPFVVTVDGPSMKVFSVIMRDPNPIHFDPDVVEALGLGRRPVNQGTLTMAYLVNALLPLVDSPEQIRSLRCRFLGNVVEGDVVTVSGIVTAVDDQTVAFDLWLDRAEGTRALSGSAVLQR